MAHKKMHGPYKGDSRCQVLSWKSVGPMFQDNIICQEKPEICGFNVNAPNF